MNLDKWLKSDVGQRLQERRAITNEIRRVDQLLGIEQSRRTPLYTDRMGESDNSLLEYRQELMLKRDNLDKRGTALIDGTSA